MHRPYPLLTRIAAILVILCPCYRELAAQQFRFPLTSPAFVENKGQITSLEKGEGSTNVLYALYSENCDIFITARGISYVFRKVRPQSNTYARTSKPPRDIDTLMKQPPPASVFYSVERVDMNVGPGRISKAQIRRSRFTLPFDHSYYDVHSSDETLQLTERIEIKNIYESIDWILYLKKTKTGTNILKHDFILHPGADAGHIRVRYSDNASVSADSSGNITIRSKLGTINEQAAVVYEDDGRPVRVRTIVNRQQVSYVFPQAKIKKRTILDPELFWGTYLNSSMPGVPYAEVMSGRNVETDSKGNIYVMLNTAGGVGFPTLNPGNGAYYDNVIANSAMQILKFNPSGELLWSTFFGKDNAGTQMVVDSEDNIWITGNTSSAIPLKDNGGFFYNKFRRRFICKFSASGSLVWSTYMGNDAYEGDSHFEPKDIAADRRGNIYITGYSYSYGMPFRNPGNGAYFANGPTASFVAFVTVFDASCNLVWSTLIGNGYDPTEHMTICVDGANRIYIGVNPRGSSYPVLNGGGYFNADPYQHNAALTCFDSQFRMTWSTTVPGIPYGIADLATDRNNNLYVVGAWARGGFPVTDPGGGAFVDNVGLTGKAGAFIMKFSPTHDLLWATRFANDKQMFFKQIIADPSCEAVHVTGVMNDSYTGVPTVNDACSPGFYFPAGPAPIATGPVYLSFTTSGKQIYTSLTDFPYEYYDYNSDFDIDDLGNRIYIYGDMRNFSTIPSALKDPGGSAYYRSGRKHTYGTLLMKLTPSGINASIVTGSNGNTCGCTGTASVTPTCGVPPFSYQWSSGAITASVNDLCPGKHSVRVMDAYCRDVLINFEVPLNPNNVSQMNCTATAASCGKPNGEIVVKSVETESFPVTYSLDGGPFQSSNRFDGLAAGKYKVTARNHLGCELSGNITVPAIEPVNFIAKTIGPAHCEQSDGMLSVVSVQGGTEPFSYSVDGSIYKSSGEFTGLAAGKYYLHLKDGAGCSFMDSFVVRRAEGPSAVRVFVLDAECGNPTGSAKITGVDGGTAPFSYSLNGTAFSTGVNLNKLVPGTYKLAVKDVFGCVAETSFVIRSKPAASVSIAASDSVACYGTELVFTAVSQNVGAQFNWNGNEGYGNTFRSKIIKSGFVTVNVLTNEGCVSSDSFFIKLKNCDSALQQCIVFPNAITPNRDGKNDSFGPAAVRCEVNSYHLNIFNRYGEKIFSTSDPYEQWNANIKHKEQDNSTYVYVCEYRVGESAFQKTGSFTVVR